MLKFLSLIAEYWYVVLWLAGTGAAYVVGGRRSALAVLTIGASVVAFRYGKKTERDNHNNRAQDIHERREDAYQEIRDRNTSRDDVRDRLRKGDY